MSEEFRPTDRRDRLAWEEQVRADMTRLADEDLSEEPDEWEYDDSGNIRMLGTETVVMVASPATQPTATELLAEADELRAETGGVSTDDIVEAQREIRGE